MSSKDEDVIWQKTTLYVAGPMMGYEHLNFPAFNEAQELLLKAGYGVLNPAELEQEHDEDTPYAAMLKAALRMMLMADGVAVLEGWQSSRGASLEVYVANQVGMPAWSLDSWLDLVPAPQKARFLDAL